MKSANAFTNLNEVNIHLFGAGYNNQTCKISKAYFEFQIVPTVVQKFIIINYFYMCNSI